MKPAKTASPPIMPPAITPGETEELELSVAMVVDGLVASTTTPAEVLKVEVDIGALEVVGGSGSVLDIPACL
jgi:hypothetical protein